jgi:hypothetical protein
MGERQMLPQQQKSTRVIFYPFQTLENTAFYNRPVTLFYYFTTFYGKIPPKNQAQK